MAIYKRCSRCGKRILAGDMCPCFIRQQARRHAEYDRFSRDKRSKQFYDSNLWEKVRAEVLDMDGGIDVYRYMTDGEIVLADTVHHIVPLRDAQELGAEIDNLMSLSDSTHSMIEQKYKTDKARMQKELREMLKRYREMRRGGAV